ncbi:MAG: redoxin domain-containing protein [Actinomycetota bacterium]|nr:redoxin domain-containing protein [Actinomycetota bacterium]
MSVHGAHERAAGPRRRRRWALGAGTVLLAAGLGAYALAGGGGGTQSAKVQPVASEHHAASASVPPSARASAPTSTPGTPAPNGTFTTPAGTTATIASLRGKPTMVWFVAGGCASCAASIPAVASHFHQLRAAGLRVLTLGLYGDFAAGSKGVAQLLTFGREAAFNEPITRAGWEWGMASKSLSLAYDPAGIPDLYVLIGPTGHVRYRNSVPDSTMGDLIAAAKRLGAHAQTTAAVQPCC